MLVHVLLYEVRWTEVFHTCILFTSVYAWCSFYLPLNYIPAQSWPWGNSRSKWTVSMLLSGMCESDFREVWIWLFLHLAEVTLRSGPCNLTGVANECRFGHYDGLGNHQLAHSGLAPVSCLLVEVKDCWNSMGFSFSVCKCSPSPNYSWCWVIWDLEHYNQDKKVKQCVSSVFRIIHWLLGTLSSYVWMHSWVLLP